MKLENIIGQKSGKDILFRSFSKSTISHAYIFRGPSGVGKKTTALSFATFLNCANREANDFCGICSSCLKFASENHPDFHVLEPEGAGIKIGQIRELKKILTFPPFEAEYRVVLLPDIHKNLKRREVANSLLKTLEEPPANTVLILTADEAGDILPTIMSRGQVVRFLPLPLKEVSARLQTLKNIGRDEADTLAAVSGGSIGRALTLADQELLDLRVLFVDGVMATGKDQGDAAEKIILLAEQVSGLKENIFEFLTLLNLWVRDLVLLASGKSDDVIINQDLQHTFDNALSRWSLPELFQRLKVIDKAKKQLERNCNKVSVCEVLLWDFL